MRNLGYLLITGSFLVGSYFSVVDAEQIVWTWVGPALVVGLAGVGLIQLARRGDESSHEAVQAGLQQIEESLARIVENSAQLDRSKEEIDPYEVRHRIDELFMEDLDIFVQSRERIGHRYGLQAYANVMSHFATGERYLNRAWSASTDGYIDEVHAYLARASEQFSEALDLLRAQHSPQG
jgi:hypothetical protein